MITRADSAPHFTDCPGDLLPGSISRTSFFDGMILSQGDLENEQRYWRMKGRLRNRALGSGVVWGLRMEWNPQLNRLSLAPGYALDCCGNDLVVGAPHELRLAPLLADPAVRALLAKLPTAGIIGPEGPAAAGVRTVEVAIALQYAERAEEPRPVHDNGCGEATRCEPTRVRETTRIIIVPPPSPLRSEALAALASDANDLVSKLSDDEHKALVPQPIPEATPSPPFVLLIRTAGEERAVRPAGSEPWSNLDLAVTDSVAEQRIVRCEMKPDPGYVVIAGTVTDNAGRVLAQVGAPDTLLAWRMQADADQPLHIRDLMVAPLAGGERTSYGFELSWSFTELVLDDKANARIVSLRDLSLKPSGPPIQPAAPTPFPDCLASLDGALFTDVPGASGAAITILGALSAWLNSTLQGADARVSGSYDGKRALAVWIYTTAVRLVGMNPMAQPSANMREQLGELLKSLLAHWSRSFLYPGPRCSEPHHAVILGTAQVTTAGEVLRVDAWKGRRQVLTGPYLSHLGSQVGLAPLDVVASRFARAVSCLADPTRPAVVLPELPRTNVVTASKGAAETTWSGVEAALAVDGFYLALGELEPVQQRLRAIGLREQRVEVLSPARFALQLAEAFARRPQTSPAGGATPPPTEYVHYRVAHQAGVALHLVVAVERCEQPASRLRHYVTARVDASTEIGATQRRLVIDYTVALMAALPLSALATLAPIPPADLQALLSSLATVDVASAAALLAWDPEELAAAAADARRDLLDRLWRDAESAVQQVVVQWPAITKRWRDGTIQRADLADAELAGKMAEVLQGKVARIALPLDVYLGAGRRAAATTDAH